MAETQVHPYVATAICQGCGQSGQLRLAGADGRGPVTGYLCLGCGWERTVNAKRCLIDPPCELCQTYNERTAWCVSCGLHRNYGCEC